MTVPFSVGIEWDGDLVTLLVTGELDLAQVPQLRTAVLKSLAEYPIAVLVNVAGMTAESDLPLAALPSMTREAAQWPAVPLLLYGAHGSLAVRLAGRPYAGVYTDREHAVVALALPVESRPVVRVSLPYELGSARTSRDVVREACRDWCVMSYEGAAELVVTELVTNAVRHAEPPLRLMVALRGAYLHLAVRDGSERFPKPHPRTDGFAWRGLHLVNGVTTAWGTSPCEDGKTVWAIVHVRPVNGRRRKDDLAAHRRG
jgi:hypothetical protein